MNLNSCHQLFDPLNAKKYVSNFAFIYLLSVETFYPAEIICSNFEISFSIIIIFEILEPCLDFGSFDDC